MIVNYAFFLILLSSSYLLATFDEHTGPAALSMIADSNTKGALENIIPDNVQELAKNLVGDASVNKPLPRILLNGKKSARHAALALASQLNIRYALIKEANNDLSQTLHHLSESMKQEPLAIIIYPNDKLIKTEQEKDLFISFANTMPTNCILIGVDPNIQTLSDDIKRLFLNTNFPNSYQTQLTVQPSKELSYYYFLHAILQNIEFVFTKNTRLTNVERTCCGAGAGNEEYWCCSAGMLSQQRCSEHLLVTTYTGPKKIERISELFKPYSFTMDEITDILRSHIEKKSIYQVHIGSDDCTFFCWPFCNAQSAKWALAKDTCKCHETQYSSCVTIDLDTLKQKIELIVQQKKSLHMNSKEEAVRSNNPELQELESDDDDIQRHFEVTSIEVPEMPANSSFRYKLWKFFGC